jgi:very-short-patch-repair endonuclease
MGNAVMKHDKDGEANSALPSPEGRGAGGEVPKFPIIRHQPVTRLKLELAKQLRRAMTPEETMLWHALRRNAVANLHFRRQQIIAGFIADFYYASARLAVEIDGASHAAQQGYDAQRDHVFSELGIRTLRLNNESVTRDLASVLRLIQKEAFRNLSRRFAPPSP